MLFKNSRIPFRKIPVLPFIIAIIPKQIMIGAITHFISFQIVFIKKYKQIMQNMNFTILNLN